MNEGTRLTQDRRYRGNFWNERTILEKILFALLFLAVSVGIVLSIVIASQRKSSKISDTGPGGNVCITAECIGSAARLISSMDLTVDPCKDFFQFSCGGWMKKTFLLGDSVSRFTKLNVNIMLRMKELLEMPVNDDIPLHWLKTKYFYKSCLDLSARQERKASSLINDLERFGLWPPFQNNWDSTKFNWVQVLKDMFQWGYDYRILLSIYVDLDLKNSSHTILAVDQPSLGMGNRIFYLFNSSENLAIEAYRSFIWQSVFLLYPQLKLQDTMKHINEAMEIEKQLAKASLSLSERSNFEKSYNKMSLAELEEFIPEIKTLIESLLPESKSLADDEEILIPVPEVLIAVGKIIKENTKQSLANYMMYRMVLEATHDLSHFFVQLFYDFYNALSGIFYSYPDPWQQCVDLTGLHFFHSIASVYSRKYFENETKNDVTSLLAYIEDALKEQIHNAKWMDQETKTKASDKANKMHATIGYPDEILNDTYLDNYYEKIQVNGIHYENVRKIQSYFSMMSMDGLHETYNKRRWDDIGNLLLANAYYRPTKNSITIPVGVLQDETYNSKQPNYLNYGSLGMVIGHELSHGFDNKGNKFDEEGNWDFWWHNNTYQKFVNKTHCFVNQYNQYEEKSVNKTVNGTRTLGENIADSSGLYSAYMAYKKWVAGHGAEKSLPGLPYSPKQLFWVSFATFWCSKQTENNLFAALLKDVHAPHEYRVKGAVSNIQEFAQDFKCPKESPMNPSTKCSIWT